VGAVGPSAGVEARVEDHQVIAVAVVVVAAVVANVFGFREPENSRRPFCWTDIRDCSMGTSRRRLV